LDIDELKRFAFRFYDDESDKKESYFLSKSVKDIVEKDINGRSWVHIVSGDVDADLVHLLYSALDDQHVMCVHYSPNFWPFECKEISQKAYEISLTPLWDFMDNLTIEEIREDKTYLTGKVEPDNKESFKHPGQDDDLDDLLFFIRRT